MNEKDRLSDFTDNRQYWGHAFSLLNRVESFLLDHVPIAGKVVSGKMTREDQPWYPPRAMREAIANALCHRDYTIPGGAVSLSLYDDHLEVVNPGTFHFGITPDKLAEPHESRPWNPIIANVLYRAGIIERWGSGTLNIIDWCLKNGNPAPTWKEQAGSVYLSFHPVATQDETPSTAQVAAQVLLFCTEPRKASEIRDLLQKKHRKTFQRNYLNPLLEIGIIERTIPDKPTSSKQKYKAGPNGRSILKNINVGD